MLNKFTIYGERCSGTNYIEQLILLNFETTVTWEYGFKHFFGFMNIGNSDDTLFIGVVRDPVKWINSLYRTPHHICCECKHNKPAFLNKPIYSQPNDWDSKKYYGPHYKFFGEDRHIYTRNRYTNIFEMRDTKLRFLVDDMPNKVKHYLLIRYEDMLYNFEETMEKIKNAGLSVKPNISFPVNYIKNMTGNTVNKKKPVFEINQNDELLIPEKIIKTHPAFKEKYEKQLGYL